jgi:DNA-directed RNA polymerase specialized sigma subunit
MLYSFFRRYAPTDNNRFETTAAINVGTAIRDELRRQEPLARSR